MSIFPHVEFVIGKTYCVNHAHRGVMTIKLTYIEDCVIAGTIELPTGGIEYRRMFTFNLRTWRQV